eukprot:scaffold48194_cov69-Phaeocystis_antarctica.AAC.5
MLQCCELRRGREERLRLGEERRLQPRLGGLQPRTLRLLARRDVERRVALALRPPPQRAELGDLLPRLAQGEGGGGGGGGGGGE